MIRTLIIEDEPLAQDILVGYIEKTPELTLVEKCNNAFEAFEILHRHMVDLMFVDIRMPGMSGLEFIRSLKNPPAVIFITASAGDAISGFELDAADYLLKPVTYERFRIGIDKVLKRNVTVPVLQPAYHYFKVSGTLVKVQHADLLYAQSLKDYLVLHTKLGKLVVHMTMKYLEGLLPANKFIRIHRSFLVNKHFVTSFDRMAVRINEVELPVGENFRKNLSAIE